MVPALEMSIGIAWNGIDLLSGAGVHEVSIPATGAAKWHAFGRVGTYTLDDPYFTWRWPRILRMDIMGSMRVSLVSVAELGVAIYAGAMAQGERARGVGPASPLQQSWQCL